MTRLAYILAASHSGSTLLTMILGSHPDLCTIGEMKATSLGDVGSYRCSCGALVSNCAFWSDIRRDMAGRGFEFDITHAEMDFGGGANALERRLLRPLYRRPPLEWCREAALALSPGWPARLQRLQARNAAFAECVCARRGARVIVDSSKVGLRLKFLLRNPALDVVVIRLIRDGRAVALTYTDPALYADATSPALRGGGGGANRDAERLSISEAAREWRRSNEEADALLHGIDRRQSVEVRYEALCVRPRETLEKVFQALGVEPSRAPAAFRSVEHHVIGNGMRLDSSSAISLDERWRFELDEPARGVFDRVAGGMNRRFGYR